MAPSKRAAWINLILQLAPIIVKMVKPELAPIADQIAQSIASAEDTHGNSAGEAKLKQVATDIRPEIGGFDSVTIGDVKKIVSATVDTANLIHDVKKKVSK